MTGLRGVPEDEMKYSRLDTYSILHLPFRDIKIVMIHTTITILFSVLCTASLLLFSMFTVSDISIFVSGLFHGSD